MGCHRREVFFKIYNHVAVDGIENVIKILEESKTANWMLILLKRWHAPTAVSEDR